MILRFVDFDGFIYGAHVLGEASTTGVRPLGGNVLEVPDAGWEALDDEQRSEIARFVVDPTVGLAPPGEAEGGAAAPDVGRRPAAPQSLQPLRYPPETGPGSGRGEWVRFAIAQGVDFDREAKRDDIIAAVKAQRPEVVPAPPAADVDETGDPDAPPAPGDELHPDAPPVMTAPTPGTDQEAHDGGQ